jgi:4-amino-4-deoxy-L-arabinose transferase-like glycosyltransferase
MEKKLTWAAFVGIVLLAAFFRFYAMNQVPPGPHYDETIDARLALDIRAGARPVFFSQGWGREPLYHYIVALVMNWIDMPLTALRVTSATFGTLAVALAFLFLRRLFDWRVAAIGGAWLACSFWAMSVSRLGVRNVIVQPWAIATLLAFWQWKKSVSSSPSKAIIWLVVSGALLGLTLYTYQSSRVLPILIVLFIAYLAIFDRKQLAGQWKNLILSLTLTAVIAAPLVIYLVTHPDAESGRAFMGEPIQQLFRGDPGPALAGTFATFKMFTFSGDAQVLYNVPGRPALAVLAGAAFYIGLIVALIRFRKSEFAFVLLWLFTALVPAMVTSPAPNFVRTVLAQAPAAALIAIGVSTTGDMALRAARGARWAQPVVPLLAILVIGQTAIQTWRDYFVEWANLPEARLLYGAGPMASARYLDANADANPVVLAGLSADDSDPINFSIILHRHDLDLRWFYASSALPVPVGARTLRLVLYDFTPLDNLLRLRYLNGAKLIAEKKDVFWVYRLNADDLRANLEQAQGLVQAASGMTLTLPVSFGNSLSLLGYDVSSRKLAPGDELTILTRWRATNPGSPQPVAIFTHLLNASDQLVAQDDRLGYPHHGWEVGDEFAQVHHIAIPPDAAPGTYSLKLGLYFRDTMARWPVAGGDLMSLGSVEIQSTSNVSH